MKTVELLSPQQKKAKAYFESAYFRATGLAMILLTALFVVFYIALNRMGVYKGSGNCGFAIPFAWPLSHYWALQSVRRAGLSMESVTAEPIPVTTQNFSGETRKWRTSGTGWRALTCFLICLVSWGLWNFKDDLFARSFSVAALPFFLVVGVGELLTWPLPQVKINDQGIAGFQFRFWRRHVSWSEIAHCELVQRTDYLGNPSLRSLIFVDGNEKKRVTLSPNDLIGVSTKDFTEIEAEVRRRLGGDG